MSRHLLDKLKSLLQRRQLKEKLAKAAMVMSCLVVFMVTYMLVAPVLTQEWEPQCGLEEHIHTDECYELVPVEPLENEDVPAAEPETADSHHHTEECYTETTKLVCEVEEHSHSEGCYDEEGNLICGKEEHTHTEECEETTRELTCGLEETAEDAEPEAPAEPKMEKVLICGKEEHEHSDLCYHLEEAKGPEYICGYPEEHKHTESCYFEDGTLKCTLTEHIHDDTCLVEGTGDDEQLEVPVLDETFEANAMLAADELLAAEDGNGHPDTHPYMPEITWVDSAGVSHTMRIDYLTEPKHEYGNAASSPVGGNFNEKPARIPAWSTQYNGPASGITPGQGIREIEGLLETMLTPDMPEGSLKDDTGETGPLYKDYHPSYLALHLQDNQGLWVAIKDFTYLEEDGTTAAGWYYSTWEDETWTKWENVQNGVNHHLAVVCTVGEGHPVKFVVSKIPQTVTDGVMTLPATADVEVGTAAMENSLGYSEAVIDGARKVIPGTYQSVDGTNYYVVDKDGTEKTDQNIRDMATQAGYTDIFRYAGNAQLMAVSEGIPDTYKLDPMPSDAAVVKEMREQVADLTGDYEVRWYAYHYDRTSGTWYVSGALVPGAPRDFNISFEVDWSTEIETKENVSLSLLNKDAVMNDSAQVDADGNVSGTQVEQVNDFYGKYTEPIQNDYPANYSMKAADEIEEKFTVTYEQTEMRDEEGNLTEIHFIVHIKPKEEEKPPEGSIVLFVKTDEDGNPLKGAQFEISGYSSAGLVTETLTSNKRGEVWYDKLSYYDMTITETNAPAGYLPLEGTLTAIDFNGFTVKYTGTDQGTVLIAPNADNNATENKQYYQVINKKAPPPPATDFTIEKTDVGGNPLPGAVFTLYGSPDLNEGEDIYTSVPAEGSNIHEFKEIKNGTWYLRETTIPSGYKDPGVTYEVTVVDGQLKEIKPMTQDANKAALLVPPNTANGNENYQIKNELLGGPELPATGGSGTTLLYATGAALALTAALLMYSVWKPKRRRGEAI